MVEISKTLSALTSASSLGVTSILQDTGSKIIPSQTTTSRSSQISIMSDSITPVSTFTGVYTTENEDDIGVLKVILTKDNWTETFYNAEFNVDGQPVDLRFDMIQPDVWVLNGNEVPSCQSIRSTISYYESLYGSDYFLTETTFALSSASVCDQAGAYTSSTDTPMPEPTISGISNGERYDIPYISNSLAQGVFITNNLTVHESHAALTFPNFTLVDVSNTSWLFGGFGLAGGSQGTGFLNGLVDSGLIKSPSYSLFFFNDSSSTGAIGELLLGAVNSKLYIGDFYSYDMLPREAPKFSGGRAELMQRLQLPTIMLTDLSVENTSGAEVSLLDEQEAVVFDSRSSYSYIPLQSLINLAVQTNAYYYSDRSIWIVECDSLRAVNATVNFQFGPLKVPIPLNNFIVDANDGFTTLSFSDGKKACFLSFLPSEVQGFSSLGLNFLPFVYLAVENEGGVIGMANANSEMSINIEDYQPKTTSKLTNHTSTSSKSSTLSSNSTSIRQMSSGFIPFATHVTNENGTLTITSASFVYGGSIPARFSGITVQSGEVFVTGGVRSTGFLPALATSKASSTTSKGAAASLRFSEPSGKFKIHWFWVTFSVLFLGFVMF